MTELHSGHAGTVLSDLVKGPKYYIESCGRTLPFQESKIVDIDTGKMSLKINLYLK